MLALSTVRSCSVRWLTCYDYGNFFRVWFAFGEFKVVNIDANAFVTNKVGKKKTIQVVILGKDIWGHYQIKLAWSGQGDFMGTYHNMFCWTPYRFWCRLWVLNREFLHSACYSKTHLLAHYDNYVVRGSMTEEKFSVFYLKNGRLIALETINDNKSFSVGMKLIKNQVSIPEKALENKESDLRNWLN